MNEDIPHKGHGTRSDGADTCQLHRADVRKGPSQRIYGELYKVIDSSEVLLYILVARDPLGTHCESVLATYIGPDHATVSPCASTAGVHKAVELNNNEKSDEARVNTLV
jgi:hypothetical protein